MAEVVIIKTTIGEEIVAELVEDGQCDGIIVSRPRVFQFHEEGGKMVPALVPWIQLDADNRNVPLNANYIATLIPASATLTKSYMSAVSGLVLS